MEIIKLNQKIGKEYGCLTKEEKKELKDKRKNLLEQRENTKKENQLFLKKLEDKKKRSKSTQSQLNYQRLLEDGICEIEKGLYSKTIKFSDINYQIAKREEQVNIFSKYCEFLNYFSSDIGVQINIVNKHIDSDEFKKNMLIKIKDGNALNEYKKEYNNMLSEKALEGNNSIMREKFLTFTAKANDYEGAIPILNRIENDILNNFKNLGVEASPLSGIERLREINEYTRPNENLDFNYDYLLSSNLTSKDIIASDSFDFRNKDYFMVNDTFNEVLFLKDLPPDLSDKLLSDLSDIPCDMTITLHINSVEQEKALDLVKSKISFMEQQKIDEQKKALKSGYDVDMIPHELKYSLNEAEQLLDDLQNKNQRMFKVTILIHTKAETLDDLKENVYQISSTARKNNCKVGKLDFLQREAFNSILPIGKNKIDIKRTLTTSSAAIFVPFTTQELFQSGGMYYGLNALSRNLIFFDRKTLKNPNGFILGTPGSGKSFAAKREMVNVLLNTDDEVLIIDPEREYSKLVESFKGEVIHISAGSQNHINPFDITEDYSDEDDPLLLKSEFILSLCELLAGGREGLNTAEKTIIDRSAKITYNKYFADMKNNPVPTLNDFYNVLIEQPEKEAKNIALALELYIKGSLSTFANQTNINLQNRLVCFDIKDLGKQLKTMGMLIVLDQIWNRITKNRKLGKRTWIYIDEVYLLFQNEYSANYLFELYKRARKWGAIPTSITQNVEDLLVSDLARRMLSNTDFILMLNQATSDRNELANLLSISNEQLSYVTNSQAGQGLIFSGNAIIPFIDKFPKDTKLYQMMTTKPEEALNA